MTHTPHTDYSSHQNSRPPDLSVGKKEYLRANACPGGSNSQQKAFEGASLQFGNDVAARPQLEVVSGRDGLFFSRRFYPLAALST